MKLTLVSLIMFASGIFASVQSQTMRINIQMQNVATQTILNEIEKQTDYLFIYNSNEVDLNHKASVMATNRTVAEVLSNIFDKTNIMYAMEGNNIMLMRREVPTVQYVQQNKRTVTGTVLDDRGETVIGANVVIKLR